VLTGQWENLNHCAGGELRSTSSATSRACSGLSGGAGEFAGSEACKQFGE
jgi:hypothetical protein